MNNDKLAEVVASRLNDLDTLLSALNISNPHNAKQALVKLRQKLAAAEATIAELVHACGADNSGNALKRIRAAFGTQTEGLAWMKTAPHSWIGTVPAARHNSELARLEKDILFILNAQPTDEAREHLEGLYWEALREESHEVFSSNISTAKALLVHGPVTDPDEEPTTEVEATINVVEKLQTAHFVTEHLSHTRISELAAQFYGSSTAVPRAALEEAHTKEVSKQTKQGSTTNFLLTALLLQDPSFFPTEESRMDNGSDQNIAWSVLFHSSTEEPLLLHAISEHGYSGTLEMFRSTLAELDPVAS